MQIVQAPTRSNVTRPVGQMPAGTVVTDGAGNVCMVCRAEDKGPEAKVRIVNLQIGGIYSVLPTCRYGEIDATLTWQYKRSLIMQTRKYPRTLQEAFGPHTSRDVQEPVTPFDRSDAIVMAGCALAVAVTVGAYLLGVVF